MTIAGESSPALRDGLAKARGEVAFGSELRVAGNLFAIALRSPFGHAQLLDVDAAAARCAPGVVAVLTPWDLSAPDVPGDLFYDQPLSRRPALSAEALHVGAPVVLLAAETLAQAYEALRLLRPNWLELPGQFSLEGALSQGGAAEALPFGAVHWQQGDPQAIFAQAAIVREDILRTSTVQAGALEPYWALVEPTAQGGFIVHNGVAAPFELRRQMAEFLGLSLQQVEVRCPPVGGGFGSRSDDLAFLAALLARHCQRPVRMQLQRSEGWLAGRVRHGAQLRVRSALTQQGRLLARELEVWYDTGAFADLGPYVVLRALRSLALYPAEHQRFIGHLLRTNKPVASATRGFGNPQATFAVEVHNARICKQLGIGSLEFRQKTAIRAGAINPSVGVVDTQTGAFVPKGARISSSALPWCLQRAQQGLEEAITHLPACAPGWLRGQGVAAAMHTTGKGRAEVSTAEVFWTPGLLRVRSGATDQGGTGVASVLAQIAGQVLGEPPEAIVVELCSTAAELADSGAHASSRTFVAGAAVWDACQLVLARRKAGEPGELSARSAWHPDGNAPPFATCAAVVDVEPATGLCQVRWMGLGVDAGRILNPRQALGQVLGAAMMGLGFALYERLDFTADGRLASLSVADYGTPRATDMPPIDVWFAPSVEESHPLGVKGIGEIGLMPVAPALVNAIEAAIGRPLPGLPATPESVWRACRGEGGTCT